VTVAGARYRDDLVRSLAWAAAALAVAVPALLLSGAGSAVRSAQWLALPVAAFGAAVLASGVVFLLRPLRAGALGWALSGAGIALGIGLSLGVALAVIYEPLGAQLLGVPRDAALALLPRTVIAVLLVGGGIGGYLGYRERTGASVF
jgi:hypothetical protein